MRLERWRAAKRWWRGRTSPTLSLCVITAGEPGRVRRLLEAWRPHVDEIFLALDERGPHEEIARAVADLADRMAVLPAMSGMERYLGWAHAQCTGDWILRVDDDELPSRALREALRSLLAERELTHVWLPRRWVHPNPRPGDRAGPVGARHPGPPRAQPARYLALLRPDAFEHPGRRRRADRRGPAAASRAAAEDAGGGVRRRTGTSAPGPGSPTTRARRSTTCSSPRTPRTSGSHRWPRTTLGRCGVPRRAGEARPGRRRLAAPARCAPRAEEVERFNEDRPVRHRVRRASPARAPGTPDGRRDRPPRAGRGHEPRRRLVAARARSAARDLRRAPLAHARGHRARDPDAAHAVHRDRGPGSDHAPDRGDPGATAGRRARAGRRCCPRVGPLARRARRPNA